MGYMTLPVFEEQLDAALGNNSLDVTELDPWINYAYLDIAGAIKFEELEDTATITLAAGTPSYSVPSRSKVVKGVSRPTTGLLDYMDKMEYFRLDRTLTGVPIRWARHGMKLWIHPKPTAVEALDVIYKREPIRLIGTAVTELQDTWDAAIYMLSVVYGAFARNEDERAMMWLARVVSYIQSRVTDKDLEVSERGLELTFGLPLTRQAAIQAMLSGTGGQ